MAVIRNGNPNVESVSKKSAYWSIAWLCILTGLGALVASLVAKQEEAPKPTAKQVMMFQDTGFPVTAFYPDGGYIIVVDKIKAKLDDPDSFEHVASFFGDVKDGKRMMLCIFRAKNRFGALVKYKGWVTLSADSKEVENITYE